MIRTGFVIDHVHYFSDALKPWIARRGRLGRFVIRRDRSHIWVLNPEGRSYLPVPNRTRSYPVVSVWEHRAALEWLRDRGRAHVDEEGLFRVVEQLRTITDTASSTPRKARSNAERGDQGDAASPRAEPTVSPPSR